MTEDGRHLVTDREKAEAFKTYAHVSRQVRSPKVDRAAKRRYAELKIPPCEACNNLRDGRCGGFTAAELDRQLLHLHRKKAPGPDGICNEQ